MVRAIIVWSLHNRLIVILGVIALIGAAFKATTGGSSTDFTGATISGANSVGIAKTGCCATFAISIARDFGYTNSWPQLAPG